MEHDEDQRMSQLTDGGTNSSSNGQAMPPGVYVWYTEIRMKDGSVLKKKGDVLLVR
jgi:hypothetical protein